MVLTNWNAVADALVAEGAKAIAKSRAEAAARPVGTEGLTLGLTDYRRPPDPRIDSHDWAVWRVRWDGSDWVRVKRLAANKEFSEALDSLSRWRDELGLPCVEAMHNKAGA